MSALQEVNALSKKSFIAKDVLTDIEAKFWVAFEEYKKNKQELEREKRLLSAQKDSQKKLIQKACKNEIQRIFLEYNGNKGNVTSSRLSRKTLLERKAILKGEELEMLEVIQQEYNLQVNQVEKILLKSLCLLGTLAGESLEVFKEFESAQSLMRKTSDFT